MKALRRPTLGSQARWGGDGVLAAVMNQDQAQADFSSF